MKFSNYILPVMVLTACSTAHAATLLLGNSRTIEVSDYSGELISVGNHAIGLRKKEGIYRTYFDRKNNNLYGIINARYENRRTIVIATKSMQPLLVLPGIFMIGSSYSEIFTSSEINSTSPYLFLQGTRAVTNSTKFLGSSYLQDQNDDPFYEIRERANPRAMLPLSKDLLRSQANGFGMPLVNCVAENGDIYGQYSWIRYSKAFQEIRSKPPIEPTKRVVDCWSDGDVLKLLEREDNETHSFFIAENGVDKKLGTVNGIYLTMIRTVNSPSKILVIGGIDKNQQKKLFWANTSTAAPTLNALVESFPPTAKEIGFVERTNTLYFSCNGLSKSDELHSTCFFSVKFHDGTATVQSYPQIDALLGLYNPNQRAAWVPGYSGHEKPRFRCMGSQREKAEREC